MICGIKMKLSSLCFFFHVYLLFLKAEHLTRHFPSWTSGLESLRWCSCFALSLCGCPCFGGDLIHQKLEMQITSIIWAPVVSSAQWWFPWHVLSIVFEKKAPNPSPNKCWHGIYMYRCNSNSCVFLQEWWEEIVWNTSPPLCCLGRSPIQVWQRSKAVTLQWYAGGLTCAGDVWPRVSTNSLTLLGFCVFLDRIVVLAITRLEFSFRGAGGMYNCSCDVFTFLGH